MVWKKSSYNWNELLTSCLLSICVQQSKCDVCLCLHKYIICVIYVDDTILFAPEESTIDNILTKLKINVYLTY